MTSSVDGRGFLKVTPNDRGGGFEQKMRPRHSNYIVFGENFKKNYQLLYFKTKQPLLLLYLQYHCMVSNVIVLCILYSQCLCVALF